VSPTGSIGAASSGGAPSSAGGMVVGGGTGAGAGAGAGCDPTGAACAAVGAIARATSASTAGRATIVANVARRRRGRHRWRRRRGRVSLRAMRRWALAIVTAIALAACTDLRDYRGDWDGVRVGDAPALRVGVGGDATAELTVATIDRHGLGGRLTVTDLVDDAALVSLEGAEADALASLTFTGAPARVYLGFVATTDGGGDALAVVAIFDDPRIELRLLRGGARPIYAVFAFDR
jgi:hypothetical protein